MEIKCSARAMCKLHQVTTEIISADLYNPALIQFYKFQQNLWDFSKQEEILNILGKLSFFKRYSKVILVNILIYFYI